MALHAAQIERDGAHAMEHEQRAAKPEADAKGEKGGCRRAFINAIKGEMCTLYRAHKLLKGKSFSAD